MNDINFVTVDSETIKSELITQFETAYGETLSPGDERYTFLLQLLPIIVGLKNDINNTGRQNLLRNATGDLLDALGEFFNCTRLAAQKATVTLQFTLSAAQSTVITIPVGTRVTPDGTLYFTTITVLTITAGNTTGTVIAEATVAGWAYNEYASGQIKNIVDSVPYVASVTNTDTSAGGSDVEPDDDGINVWSGFRERIRLAPESYSIAGPEGAYKYWALTADSNIVDVDVSSPSAGVVQIVPLLKDGVIPGQTILDKVLAVCSAKDKRPLTDNVKAATPTQVSYDITLKYYISSSNQAVETSIKSAIEGDAINQYKAWQCAKLGRAINPDQLRYLILKAGASRIELTSPTYTALTTIQVAAVGAVTLTYGGLE